MAMDASVRRRAPAACPVQRRVQPEPVAQQQQADHRLGVLDLGDQRVQLGERPALDRDPLALDLVPRARRAGRWRGRRGRLVGEADRRVVGLEVLPLGRGLADLLGQLAPRALERALPRLVELARPAARARPGCPTASRGWRTSQTCSPSWATIPTDPGCSTHWRVTSSPSSWRKRPSLHGEDGALEHPPRRRGARSASSWQRRRLVEQRQAHVERALQRRHAHALGRLVVALGAVGDVDALDPLQRERVRVRAAAGGDADRLVAARAQRGLRGHDGGAVPFWR